MNLYTHLLVPSDGSERSDAAVRHAIQLAATMGARITFFYAEPSVPLPVMGMGEMLDGRTMEALVEANRKETERVLSTALEQARSAGIVADTERAQSDLPHEAILETARRLGCDLIVMASHGRRGLSGLLLGSETQRVLVQAPCPVLVYR